MSMTMARSLAALMLGAWLLGLESNASAQDPGQACNSEGVCHTICNSYEDWTGPHWLACDYDLKTWPDTACGYMACESLDHDMCVLEVQPAETCITSDGREGTPTCEYWPNTADPSQFGTMNYECRPGQPWVTSGSAYPKFLVVTVVYAPPGSKSGMSGTKVTYGMGNKLGTTVKASSSVKEEVKVGVGVKGTSMGSSAGFDFTVGSSDTRSESDSMSITKSNSYVITVPAPDVDGIDHNFDQIWVNLEPELLIDIAQAQGCESCSQQDELHWRLAPGVGTTISLQVGELNGAWPMRESNARALENHGITQEEWSIILQADPLADMPGDSTEQLDARRFKIADNTFPFVPPQPPAHPNMQDYTMVSAMTAENEDSSTHEYSVALKVTAESGFTDILSASLSYENNWTWTSAHSEERSRASDTQAIVTIGTPSLEYTGPAAIAVYFDKIYGTYAFVGAN